ncbi:unnamed protein product [Blepharisma stoltei]|uniref:Sulfatase N-terminal domain-containing protein n=1 Tax=Blepharisma stoltei TaxID=1481888 RepID=A0AAU9ISH3_9CILI|nr:unnamed protein product [Blepharisma stoltei]
MNNPNLSDQPVGKLQPKDAYFFFAYLASFKISTLLYVYTLQGGDVKYVTGHLVDFGICLAISVLSTLCLTILPIFYFSQINIAVKIAAIATGWLIFMASAIADLSTTLLHHGQYNLTAFFMFWTILFMITLSIKFCFYAKRNVGPKKFWICVIIIALLWVYIWESRSEVAIKNWNKTLGGDHLVYKWPRCNIELRGTPWMAILPDRTMNFFMGSNDCPKVKKIANLNNGVLEIDCDEKYAEIIENPDFLSAHTDPFIIDETGIENWIADSKGLEKKYKVTGKSTLNITSEYFQVKCGSTENYFVQNTPIDDVKQRLNNKTSEISRMNLLIFQIDTLSRAHFMRKLVKTVKKMEFLNSTNEYDVFEMVRLSTIGFNTELNTKALYTGSQLRQNRSGRPIWEIFQKQDNAVLYLNGFCEDWSWRFLKKKPYGMDHLVFKPWCHPAYHPVNTTFSNFNGVNSMRRRCIDGKPVNEHLFGYLKQFWNNYKEYGKMVLSPLQEAHEASMEVIATLDPGLSSLLDWFYSTGNLNNTVLIITSDHGSHMSLYYTFSQAGRIEHKMPEIFMIFPKWFTEKYPHIKQGLLENKQRLMSHYDTHWTIRSLAKLPEFRGSQSNYDENLNSHTSLWDCQANEKYMKDIWYFREKEFYNADGWDNFDNQLPNVFTKLRYCIDTYEKPEPDEDPMKHELPADKSRFLGFDKPIKLNLENVPSCKSKTCYDVTVYDVIKDYDSYIWLLDAAFDLEMQSWISSENFINKAENITQEKLADIEAWGTLHAPGTGRFRFGYSLFNYTSDRGCKDIGSMECPCS